MAGKRKKPAFKPIVPIPNPLKNTENNVIDYKNVELLEKFVTDRGKIRSREVTGVTVQEQRRVSEAIKNARELALLPFIAKQTQAGGQRRDFKKKGRYND